MLAAVHRSIPNLVSTALTPYDEPDDFRESDSDSWWKPRAKKIAQYIAEELSTSDIVLLQEWWTRSEFVEIFDQYTSHVFGKVTHRRPGLVGGKQREDGMAVLVNHKGKWEIVESHKIVTRPGRIAQIVHLREKNAGRSLFLANVHLSFPTGGSHASQRRQAYEMHCVARALGRAGREKAFYGDDGSHLQVIGGDFNSNSQSLAAQILEQHPYHFANCMSAQAWQSMASSVGGRMDLGVTHRNHLGQEVSVDHVLARIVRSNGTPGMTNGLLKLGYLDACSGAQVVDCRKKKISLRGKGKLSDHRPVTARIQWDTKVCQPNHNDTIPTFRVLQEENNYNNSYAQLHPLQSPWDS